MPRTKARQSKEIIIQGLRGELPPQSTTSFDDKTFNKYLWSKVRVTCVDMNNDLSYHFGRLIGVTRPNRDNIRTITLYAKHPHHLLKWHFYSHSFLDSLDGFKLELDRTQETNNNMIQTFLQIGNRFPQDVLNNIHKFLTTDFCKIL